MQAWLLPAVFSLVAWGVWAFLPKLALRYLEPKSVMIYEIVGVMLVGIGILISVGWRPAVDARGIGWAMLTGALGVSGGLAYLYAVSKGPIGLISVLTALYPVITLVLAYLILQEPLSIKQMFGAFLGLVAIWLMVS